MAKAFLERDYEAVRARRATSQQPAEDTVMGETEVEIKPEQEAQAQPQRPSLAEPVKKEDEDRGEAVKREPEPKPISQDVKALPADDEKPSHPPAEIDLTTAPAPQEGQHQQHAGTVVPGAAEPSGIDFDSVLNDSAGGANDFDLDLDFGGDVGLGNQNFLGVGSGGGQEQEQGKGAGEEAMTTDAAGMEGNAASIGGDAFDMELQKAGAADPGMQGQQGGNNAEEMMPGPSSFDDLFMEHDSMGESNLLEGDGLMNLNELDDSWFN
jgi:hypothetical protein